MNKMIIPTIVLFIILASPAFFAAAAERAGPYVFVHGGNMSVDTWNKLTIGKPYRTPDGRMGGLIWEPLIPSLTSKGHTCFNPTFGDEHKYNLSDNIAQVIDIIDKNALKDVVLVGHSYGGMIITALAAKIPDKIRHMVYVDAAFPDPGQSLFDLIRAGGADPLSFPGLEADPPYVEKLQFDASKIKPVKKTYIRCTKSDFKIVTDMVKKKIDADGENWEYLELPSSHVPMAEMPERLVPILLKAAKYDSHAL